MTKQKPNVPRTLRMGVAMLAALMVSSPATASRWAIVVGIDQYANAEIPRLSGAVADAVAMKEAFQRYVEVPDSNLVLLTGEQATRSAITDALDRIRDEIRKKGAPDDLLLFFFAGHGVETADGHFLMGYDTQVRDRNGQISEGETTTSSLDAQRLTRTIESINVRHRVIMIDTCRKEPIAGKRNLAGDAYENQFWVKAGGESGSRATYLSTRRGYNAYESIRERRGYFSMFLERGLSGAAQEHSPDVTLDSLAGYLNANVKRTVARELLEDQWPISIVVDGSLPLVRRDRMSTTAARARLEESASRSIWGIVRNADKQLLADATVTIRRIAATSRDITLAVKPRTDQPASRGEFLARTDENGHFKIDGLPTDADLEIHVELRGHQPQTLSASPRAKEFFPVCLARNGETLAATPSKAPAPGTSSAPRALDLTGLASQEHALVARESFLVEEFTIAGESARAALSFDPDNALAHAVLANALASAVTLDETTPRDRRRTLLLEARQHVDRALALSPDLALAHNARGLMSFAAGRLNEAQAAFMTATRLDDTLSIAHANLAAVYQRRKRWVDAERSFTRAIALRPDNAIPYNGLAIVLRQQKRYADATRAARDAIALYNRRDIHLADFYVNLATIQFEDRKLDEALNAVANAKSLGRTTHRAFARIERGRR